MKNLLIVDNSIVIINVLKDMFSEKNDFKIFIAKSLNDVKDLIENQKFFAAISNMVLPDALNGELLKVLEKENIPTVVLTSNIDDEVINKMNNHNIVDFIPKDSIYGLQSTYKLINLLTYIKNMNILVVEDSITCSSKIKEILSTLLLNVIVAKDGEEALNILKNDSSISLIISDYDMPKMNGMELLKKIRKDKNYSSLPLVMISATQNSDLKIKLYKNGVNDIISKPFLKDELKAKILNIFSNKKQIEEINSFNKIFDENIISSSTDTKGIIKSVSNAFCEISGYSKNELIGQNHSIVKDPEMPKSIYKELWTTIQKGKIWKGEIRNLRKDGSNYWVSAVIEPVFDKDNKISSYYAIRQDITDKKRIYELSITDGLTTLFNRRHFNDIAESIIDKTIRNNNVFAFLLLDVDNFKKYNDTYGHQEGDNVLISIATSLKKSFKRSNDIIFRLGGEEFGVLISAKTQDDILKLAETARKDIQDLQIEHSKNEPSLVITASFGIAIINNKNSNTQDLDYIYKKADDCLYEAKESGRNRVQTLEL
ncbi:diguanylate cyclase [Poseidonibacter sp.]|uniref:GGDEF domain-containing response regulator n=1 Tax=Poseidonibacter sp. TaxID=2321188 RepID=UPI003C71A044